MEKIILITGATDGIGLEAAKMLVSMGHHVLLHGRNPSKLEKTKEMLSSVSNAGKIESYVADLSRMADVENFANKVTQAHNKLDVLINNAGIFKTSDTLTPDGLDVRFAVNTIAPYLLTKRLLPLMDVSGRIINLSSAAQSPVNIKQMAKHGGMDDMSAYSQSKLAITMWSSAMARSLKQGPVVIALNPGSLLSTKMVKEGFGIAGNDISIGAKITIRTALDSEFADASGKYFDNDQEQFASPHPAGLNPQKCDEIVKTMDDILAEIGFV